MELSVEKQRIYNDHLATSRSMRDKPFRIRKNFENFDKDKEIYLDRLNKFFGSYPNIDIKEYFSAPYYLYDDVDYFDLEYFTTQKAKKDYAQYMNQLGITKFDIENRILEFMFKDFWKTFQKTKNMFYASTKMKKLAKQAIQKL
jgi:hypothetical protein